MIFNEAMSDVLSRVEEQAYEKTPALAAPKTKARFVVEWNFDGTRSATVTIDRRTGLIEVRPFRRRRPYVLPLADVAAFICERIVKAESQAKRKARRSRR